MKLTPVDYDPFAEEYRSPRLVPVDYDPFGLDVSAVQKRLNVRKGLNPDGSRLQPGAGHGERRDGVDDRPIVNNDAEITAKRKADAERRAIENADRSSLTYAADRALSSGATSLKGVAGIVKSANTDYGTGLPAGLDRVIGVGANIAARLGADPALSNALNARAKPATEYGESFAGVAGEYADSATAATSPQEKAKKQELAEVEGAFNTLKHIAQNPSLAPEMFLDSVGYMAAGFGAGGAATKLAGMTARAGATAAEVAAASAPAAIASNLTTQAVMSSSASSQDARAYVEQLPPNELALLPEFQALNNKYNIAEARKILAQRAADQSFAAGLVINAATLGLTHKISGLERALHGARGPTTNRAVNALYSGGGEVIQEAGQGGGEQFATNVGTSGVDSRVGLFDDVGKSAVLEGITAAAPGAAGGFVGDVALTPQAKEGIARVADRVAKEKALKDEGDALQAQRAAATTPDEVGALDAQIALNKAKGEQVAKVGYREAKRAENAARSESIQAEQFQSEEADRARLRDMIEQRGLNQVDAPIEQGQPDMDQDGARTEGGLRTDAPLSDGADETQILASRDMEPPADDGIEVEEFDENDPLIQRMIAEQQAGMDRREIERREGPSDAVTEGLRALAKNPDLFRSKLYAGKTMREMANEGDFTYAGIKNDPDTGVKIHKLKLDQGDKGINEAQIHESGNDVWVNVADLKEGGGNAEAIYSAAFSLALNNGKNFIEDPDGLSDSAMYRRVVQELSAMLKSDTSQNIPTGRKGDFLSSQRRGGPATRPLASVPGREINPSLRERAETAYHNALLAVPEIKGIRYDADKQQFVDRAGSIVSGDDFDRLAATRRADPIGAAMVRKRTDREGSKSAPPIGGNTLKVAALIETLRSTTDPESRSAMVGKLRKIAASSAGLGELKGILPSRVVNEQASDIRGTDGPSDADRVDGITNAQARPGNVQRADGMPISESNKGARKKGIAVDAIKSELIKAFGTKSRRLLNSGATNLVQSEKDVPANIRNRLKPLSEGDGTIQGFYDPVTKKSYLIADNIKSVESARAVFLHEEGVHAGMKGILGDRFPALAERLRELRRTGSIADKRLIKRAIARVEAAGTPAQYYEEELIAHVVELAESAKDLSGPMRKWIDTVYAAIRAWAAGKGIGISSLSVDDIRLIARAALSNRARSDGSAPLESTVFHGTPHTVDKFRMDKMGTGEGAQAYGYGLYFAGRREVAEGYRQRLAGGTGPNWQRAYDAALAVEGMTSAHARSVADHIQQWVDGGRRADTFMRRHELVPRYVPAYQAAVDAFGDVDSGQLYQAEIPEDSDLLDWDKPLSEQPEKVKAALEKAATTQALSQISSGDANRLSDITNGKTFREHGFSGLDVPSQRVVLNGMRQVVHNRQVFDAIVPLIPVDMVNILRGKEFSSDGLLHDPSMLLNLLSGKRGDGIPLSIDAANSAIRRIADASSTKHSGVSGDVVGVPKDFLSTLRAGDFDHKTGSDIYNALAKELGSPQAASHYLMDQGVSGTRYLDGTSRSKGEGSHNYVIWDEAAIGAPESVMASRGEENEDYAGEHSAPMSDSGAPANDVTGGGSFYPDDVYSSNGPRYYGDGSYLDAEAFSIINRLRGKPNAQVKIYRAVPVIKTNADKLADIDAEMAKIMRKGGKPGRYDWLNSEREKLSGMEDSPRDIIKINRGDWVSLTRAYAADHGRGALNGKFKIISKTVSARDIFTNGDSIQEWGYDPQPAAKIKRRASGNEILASRADEPALTVIKPGTVLSHGTAGKMRTIMPDSVIYMTTNDKEAMAYASGAIPGTRLGSSGEPTVVRFKIADESSVKGIDEEVTDALMDDGDIDAVVNDALADARKAGDVDFLRFEHPSATSDGVMQVYIPVYPESLPEPAASAKGASRDADRSRQPISSKKGQPENIEVDGKQRPTQNSDGKPIADTDEALTNFWRWFSDSRVVDEQGRPKVVYHGTTGDIAKFDASRRGENTGAESAKAGFFFTDDTVTAESYANYAATDAKIAALLKEAEAAESRGDWDTYDAKVIQYEELDASFNDPQNRLGGQNVVPVYLAIQNPVSVDAENENAVGFDIAAAVKKAVRGKKDGLVITNLDDAAGIANRPAGHYVVFNGAQIKSVNNRGTFSPSDDSILASRVTDAERVNEARRKASAKRATAATSLGVNGPSATWDFDGTKWDGMKGKLRELREHVQEKYLSLLFIQGDIEAQKGSLIEEDQNVYVRENLMHGRVGDQIEKLSEKHVQPLKDAMKKAGVSVKILEDYLEARAAQSRNEAIAKINDRMPDGGSGMLTAQAAAFLDGTDAGLRSGERVTPEMLTKLKAIAVRVDAVRDETLQRQVDAGLITEEAFDAYKENPNYAPLRGKDGEEIGGQGMGRGLDTRGAFHKKALGRGEGNRATNIIAEIMADAEKTIVQAEKTRVAQSLMRLVLANPNPDIWEVEPVILESKYSDSRQAVYEAVKNIDNDPGSIRVMVDGKPYRVVLKDVKLAKAIKNLGAEQLHAVFRFMGAINRYFSAVMTRYNPGFVPINMIRDLGMGIIGITSEHGLRAGKDAVVSYLPAMRALWREARGKAPIGLTGGYAQEYSAGGGKTMFQGFDNVEEIADKFNDEFKTMMQMVRDGKSMRLIARTLKNSSIVRVIDDANDTVENAMRLAAFIARRKKGDSIQVANAYAKDITVNFNRRGQGTGLLNSMFLFFNAAVQGSSRVFKLLKNPKVAATMGALAGLQFVLAMFAMGIDDEDDEGLTVWEKIPDHEKMRNIVLPIIGTDAKGNHKVKLVKIPMPYGFNFFPYLGGRLAQAMSTRNKTDVAALTNDLTGAAIDAVSPLKFTDGMQGIKPYLMKVFDSIGYNKNDFGGSITSEQPYSAFDVPRASLGRTSTPQTYAVAATALNRLGGGDEVTPPRILTNLLDRSPEDLRFLTEAFGGGILRTANQAIGMGQNIYAGVDITANDVPIIKSLFSEVDMGRATQNQYYSVSEKIEREKARVRNVYNSKGPEAARKVIAETPELDGVVLHRFSDGKLQKSDGSIQLDAKPSSLYYAHKKAEKALRSIQDRINSARTNSDLSMTDRLKELQSLESERAEAQRKLNIKWKEVSR